MKTNFEFVEKHPGFSQLFGFCRDAESLVTSHPALSAVSARKALEWLVRSFYTAKYGYAEPTASLFELVQDERFTNYTEAAILTPLHFVRTIGNRGAHGETVTPRESGHCLKCLHAVVGEFLVLMGAVEAYPPFDEGIFSEQEPKACPLPPDSALLQSAQDQIEVSDDIKALGEHIAKNAKAKNPLDMSEADTRKLYIDLALREAGWELCNVKGEIVASKACIEIQVEGMPSSSGLGFVDYVLFDDDSRPLAVIEAKKTSVDPEAGKKQAKLYADCLEKKYGIRPVIFYTNGYEYNIIDGVYNGVEAVSRRVYGFYTKGELHSLMVRRGSRTIKDMTVDSAISDRYFIQNAATAVCETYNKNRRKALVVMATGTGKTRCAISIVEILQRADFVKRVLFLADRTALVDQAKEAFVKFLPGATVCVLNDKSTEPDPNAKVVLSTYPTLINRIDCENKAYGIAAFDLIVVDECHRSIYNKYRAIFNYFDSLVLGLTATPREQVDKSTYDAFDLPEGEPTFSYDLKTAITEGFLVDFHPFERTTNLLKNGLKYDRLSDEEKQEYERIFGLNGEMPKEVSNDQFYERIINVDTIDRVLNCVMSEGLRTNSGERLGKTIIFAANHRHAHAIVDRFHVLYQELGDDYCQLVDNTVKYADSIIDSLKVPEKEPVIAVSVDMLDTGIDVPEVLNLVFFKRVYSKIKFWQMLGRGTRVCENLNVVSPGKGFFTGASGKEAGEIEVASCADKQGFYVFDFCDVFEYFGAHPDGRTVSSTKNLTQKIFDCKTQMVKELQALEHQENEDHKRYYLKYREELCKTVQSLNRDHINVRTNLKAVDKYSLEETWQSLSDYNVKEIEILITPLIDPDSENEAAAAFDLWLFNMELAEIIGEKDYSKSIESVVGICNRLLNMTTIPAIAVRKEKLEEFTTPDYWQNMTIDKLEQVRIQVRDLLKFLSTDVVIDLLTNFQDTLIEKKGGHVPLAPDFRNFKQKVLDYLLQNTDDPTLEKLKKLEPITLDELKHLEEILNSLGTEEEFAKYANGMAPAAFIRQLVGLDNKTINEMLAKWERDYQFNSLQQEFIREIVNFVRQNGDILPRDLLSRDPFKTTFNPDDFDEKTGALLSIVQMFHEVITPQVVA